MTGPTRDPEAVYRGRLGSRSADRLRSTRFEDRLANARIVLFLVAALAPIAVSGTAGLAISAAAIVGFAASVVAHVRARRAIRRADRAVGFYRRGIDRVTDNWAGSGEDGARFLDESHPFAADLDLFGPGSLFQRLNTARTVGGETTLADWLRFTPSDPEAIGLRQSAVADLSGRLDFREDLDLLGSDVRDGLDPARLVAWGRMSPPLPSRFPLRAVATTLGLLATIGLGAWATGVAGPSPFFAVVLGELAVWWRFRSPIADVLGPVDRRSDELGPLGAILLRIEAEPFEADRLRDLRDRLVGADIPPSRAIASLARLVRRLDSCRNPLVGPFAAMTMTGTRLAVGVESWRARWGDRMEGWIDTVAEIEATASVGAYAFENPADPFPDIVEDGPIFDAEAVGHPLIPSSRRVDNDVRLGDGLRVLVVSGSNMSGKSTMLRTVGINVVLAMAGAPVRAARLRVSPMKLGATLRVQDSLQAGKSRFYAELTRLREVVRLAGGDPPLLFLLDEIFHGTNSDDRKVGAEGVIRGLVDRGAIGMVTTHDLALATIADGLGPAARNVHFADRFDGDGLVFDYAMKPGVVRHSNALALMRAVGLDV